MSGQLFQVSIDFYSIGHDARRELARLEDVGQTRVYHLGARVELSLLERNRFAAESGFRNARKVL